MDKDFNIPIIGKVRVVNFPRTMTVLALGFLAANIAFVPVMAAIGRFVPELYADYVGQIASLFKDGMLLILGYYFRDKMKQETEE